MDRDVVASPLGLMSSLVYMAGLLGFSPEIGRALEEKGWTVQRLGTLHDEDREVIDDLAEDLSKALMWSVRTRDVEDLVLAAHKASEVAWRVEGRASGSELLVAHHMKELQDKLEEVRKTRINHLVAFVPEKGTAKLARWPTKLHKRLEAAGENQHLRDSAEKTERTRWIRELKRLLEEADAPSSNKRSWRPHQKIWKRETCSHVEETCQDVAESQRLDEGHVRYSVAY